MRYLSSYDLCIVITILTLLIPKAGILIITTLMHNVKAEALTGDNKAKIKAVSGDKDENQKIKEIMLKSGDYYPAFIDTVITY